MESEGQKLRKMRHEEMKRRDKAKLRELSERIRHQKHARSARIKEIRGLCRIGRSNVRARVQALKQETLLRLREAVQRIREAERDQCATSETHARTELSQRIEEARRELEAERRAFRERYGRKKLAPGVARARARERASESNDEVVRNLPPELVPVFEHVHSSIKGSAKMSRTEAFLHWAEENPDQVHGILYEQADRDVARLVREHEETERRLAKAKRGRGVYEDPEHAAAALAAVPF